MCSEQFRGAALLLNCFVQPFLSHSGLCNLQRKAALKWVDYSGGLAHPLHPPSLAPELHTVVQSHHLCLGCCFLCLLSAIARLRLLPKCCAKCWTRVLSRALARLSSRVLCCCLLACWDRSAFYRLNDTTSEQKEG